jgi:aerobic carbon-monoxide dehydrogenase medium subunit
MIPRSFEYTRPKTLGEALHLLAGGEAKPLAGGMSLIPMMKLRLAAPDKLVDLGRLEELNYIREAGGGIHIGATTTHYGIESSALIRAKCPLLQETAAAIGDMQVRNRGTIGGSVAHADPAADYPAALLALEAQVGIAGSGGTRTMAFADFLLDTFSTALEPGEIVGEIVVPQEPQSTGTCYEKVVQPASGFAIVGIAMRIRREGGKVAMARCGVTGIAGKAYRATGVEKELEGSAASAADIQRAAARIAEGVDANSDLFASADYRKHLARIHAVRAIGVALSRTS